MRDRHVSYGHIWQPWQNKFFRRYNTSTRTFKLIKGKNNTTTFLPLNADIGGKTKLLQIQERNFLTGNQARHIYKKVQSDNIINNKIDEAAYKEQVPLCLMNITKTIHFELVRSVTWIPIYGALNLLDLTYIYVIVKLYRHKRKIQTRNKDKINTQNLCTRSLQIQCSDMI